MEVFQLWVFVLYDGGDEVEKRLRAVGGLGLQQLYCGGRAEWVWCEWMYLSILVKYNKSVIQKRKHTENLSFTLTSDAS